MKKTKKNLVLSVFILALFTIGCKNDVEDNQPETPKVVYNVGDVILSDGSVIPYSLERENFNDINLETNKPIAVIFRGGEKGSALGVGLKQSSALEWAINNTIGCKTKIVPVMCNITDFTDHMKFTSETTFSGDIDGYDNWQQICDFFDESELDASKKEEGKDINNYPMFKWASTYLPIENPEQLLEEYKSSWFIPTIAELYEIFLAKELVIKITSNLGISILQNNSYCNSSTQFDKYDEYRLHYKFDVNDVEYNNKSTMTYCIAIHKF